MPGTLTMLQTLWMIVEKLGAVILQSLPWGLGLAVLFTVLSLFQSQACNPGRPWWKSRDLLADTHYFFIVPIIAPYAKIVTLVVFALLMQGVMTADEVNDYIAHSRGPVGQMPFWAQVLVYVVGSDFLLYWCHRVFHKHILWPFHAVHHSSVDVDWTTAYRAHPINQMFASGLVMSIMIVLGVAPSIMIWLVPFDIISAAFVHANLNWTLGPLKYIIATPVFHRWHHTQPDQGGDSNFSSTFSIWDYLFGTFYMPEGQLPEEYGVDDPLFPTTWAGQMIVPFQQFMARIQAPPQVAQKAPSQSSTTA
jgi:sterol desaturase/sphingolipid hydroxylase (fatty acid hydroxylase superfamily)